MSLACVSDPDVNPLFTADVRDPDWYYRADVADWLRAHGVDPCLVYRYEVYVVDTPCVRVFEYQSDERGRMMSDPVTRTPYMMLIDSFPPSLDHYITKTWPTPYQWSDQEG